MKKFVFLLFSLVTAVACSPATTINPAETENAVEPAVSIPRVTYPPQPDPDFALIFEYGACFRNRLDTFDNAFTYDQVKPAITIPFTLTEEEMITIYEKLMAIDYFSYPETFSIDVSDAEMIGVVEPFDTYLFVVRSGNTIKRVQWADRIEFPTSPRAESLRKLARLIIKTIEDRFEFQQLPEPEFGCI
ncbi:MAG TPA: hypothetical protein VIK64_12940 [Anaerolineales bacterium]